MTQHDMSGQLRMDRLGTVIMLLSGLSHDMKIFDMLRHAMTCHAMTCQDNLEWTDKVIPLIAVSSYQWVET